MFWRERQRRLLRTFDKREQWSTFAQVRRILFGKGVSVASIIHVRRALDSAGFKQAQIVASSGFDPQKCQVMGAAKAPLNLVGTGSFLPATLAETYATADIIAYDGVRRVKVGREFLFD